MVTQIETFLGNFASAVTCARQVADNLCTTPRVLNQMAASRDAELRIAVADNPNTSLATIVMLTQDENADVRYALAENHNLDAETLNSLSEDSNPFVAQRARKTLSRLKCPNWITGISETANLLRQLISTVSATPRLKRKVKLDRALVGRILDNTVKNVLLKGHRSLTREQSIIKNLTAKSADNDRWRNFDRMLNPCSSN